MKKKIIKTVNVIIVIVVFSVFTSCNFIITKWYGIKNPSIENEKHILKYCIKKGLDTSSIYSVNSADYINVLKNGGIPDIAIFDKHGQYIEYRQTDSSCNAGLFSFIPKLKSDSIYNKTGKTELKTELKKLRTLKGGKIPEFELESYDFYLLVYWNIWTGRLNKNHVKIWEQLANANKNAKIKVIKVNLDFQEYWDKLEKDAIISKLSK